MINMFPFFWEVCGTVGFVAKLPYRLSKEKERKDISRSSLLDIC